MTEPSILAPFERCLDLASVLERVRTNYGGYELDAHWQQGEFHHDVVLRLPNVPDAAAIPILIVATNCNGGVKEVLAFDEMPQRYALWHARCPDNPEFTGTLPELRASLRTEHWFDPCELLAIDARSELRTEFRERQLGGGWVCSRRDDGVDPA